MRADFSVGDWNSSFNSLAADVYVDALSDMTSLGIDLQAANLRKACRNVTSVRSVTTSRWIARVLAQVNRQTYNLQSSTAPSFFTYIAPVKSTPVTQKGGPS